ncbi:lipoate--protein ligase family protein [Bifidobacterium panos]|uniref:Ligase n=1 Tax=Bifidobacterium panos TaxID=2675321 RepID=A0ABX1SWX9_9BIFI|nr:lipoate--protein ligase family protein [Bifidobacterium sp. DSM 109963]NMN02340.1 ligase [Bifidobacterium sp. DSM 109963]
MRGESKTPGGKLVGVSLMRVGGHWQCRLDGDFFVDAASDEAADALLRDIETALGSFAGAHHEDGLLMQADDSDSSIACGDISRLVAQVMARHADAHLVGTNAEAIATAFARALACSSRTSASVSYKTPILVKNERQSVDYEARWQRLLRNLHVVLDEPRSPAEQMAVDEQWAREVASGTRPPTLRFWQWSAPCVVVGRFQSIPDEVREDVARAEGFAVVRRCTGGGAMFIEPGNTVTYSLYAPLEFVEGLTAEQSYRLCDRWLVEALRGLHLDVGFRGLNDIVSQYGKIGGAAARRFPRPAPAAITATATDEPPAQANGAILHHVTLAYDIDAEKMSRVLNTSREKMSDKAVKSAVKRVDPLKRQTGVSRRELVDYLMRSVRSRLT